VESAIYTLLSTRNNSGLQLHKMHWLRLLWINLKDCSNSNR